MTATAYDRKRNTRQGTTERENPQPFTISNKEFVDRVMNPNSDAKINAKLKFNSGALLDRGQHIGLKESVKEAVDGKQVIIVKETFYKIAMKIRTLTGAQYICEEV